MKKYFTLRDSEGELVTFFNHGPLSIVPIVYDSKYITNKKNRLLFNKTGKVEEVTPLYTVNDETGKPFIYFITEETYREILPQLSIQPGHSVTPFN